MYCGNCGKPIQGNERFCASCGAPVVQATPSQAAEPVRPDAVVAEASPIKSRTSGRTIAIVAAALGVFAVVCLGAFALLLRSAPDAEVPPSDQPAKQVEVTVPSEGGAIATEGEPAPEAEEPSVYEQAADAYAAALDQADSYFSDEWFGQYPDSGVTYSIMNLTDDDVPELVLAAHYSNVGSHASGGQRWRPIVFDPDAQTTTPASEDEFSLFTDPLAVFSYDASRHAVGAELRSIAASTEYYAEYVEGTTLVRTELAPEAAIWGDFPYGFVDVSDRTLLDELRNMGA